MMFRERAGKLLRNPVPMDFPRQSFAANFRILTRHDYLQGHLHRIGVKDTHDCPLCLNVEIMDFKHLTVCASLADIRSGLLPLDNYVSRATLCWAAQKEMASSTNSPM